MAPIAQSGPFGPNNAVLWPEINFFVASLKKSCYNCDGTPERRPVCVDCIAGCPGGRPGPF